MASETEGEYPSIRQAIKDDDKVANIYCGIKWLLWQIGHVALGIATVVIGIPLVIVVGAIVLLWEGLCRVGDFLSRKFGDRYNNAAKKVGDTFKKTGSKAQEAPVTRRVYNECPVSLKQRPKWWDKLSKKLDEL